MGLGEPTDTVLEPQPCVPISELAGHLGAMSSAVRSFTLAYLSIYIIHGGADGYQYPAYGRAAVWDFEWMWPLLVRNIVGTYMICGLWDWVLYLSPLAPAFKPYKIVDEYPSMK